MSVGSDPLLDPRVQPFNQAQVDALRNIAGLGVGALAVGAGARGLAGLGGFLDRNLGGPPRTPLRQSFVRIPVPVEVRTRAERDAMRAAAGEDKEAGLAKLAHDAWTTAADTLGLLRRPGQAANPLQDLVGGWGQSHWSQMPWTVPTGAAALGGGLYGGWKLTDYLLDKTRTVEQEGELEEARKDYEAALAGRRKLAAACDPLEALADLHEKRGWLNPLLGTGLLGAGAIALGSGIGSYRWVRSMAEDKAVEEAVRRRQAQIAEQSPSPIIAIPTPVPIYRPHDHRSPGATRAEKAEKAAHLGRAADEFLDRIKADKRKVWDRMMTPQDGKPAKPAKPEEPPPPRPPTVADAMVARRPPQPQPT
jgi:hypothetical protein